MANPLKILTALTASSGLDVSSGDLTIANARVATAAEISSSFATPAAVTGAISSFPTRTEVTGAISSFPTRTEVTGAISSFPTRSEVTGGFVAKDASGNVTIGGGLTVNGTLTTINTTNLEITDKKIIIASGSAQTSDINGAGLYFGGTDGNGTAALASITHLSDSSGLQLTKLSENLGLSANSGIYSDTANASSYALFFASGVPVGGGNTFTGSLIASPYIGAQSGQVVQIGHLSESSGEFDLIRFSQGSSEIILTNSEIEFTNGTVTKTLTELASGAGSLSKTSYYGLRQSVTSSHSGADLTISFSGTVNDLNPPFSGDNFFFSAVTGLTSSTSEGLLELASYASFDVAVKAANSNNWTNDLVSVTVTASNDSSNVGGSVTANYWFPKFTISAPSLTSGAKIRLIVVNEKDNAI